MCLWQLPHVRGADERLFGLVASALGASCASGGAAGGASCVPRRHHAPGFARLDAKSRLRVYAPRPLRQPRRRLVTTHDPVPCVWACLCAGVRPRHRRRRPPSACQCLRHGRSRQQALADPGGYVHVGGGVFPPPSGLPRGHLSPRRLTRRRLAIVRATGMTPVRLGHRAHLLAQSRLKPPGLLLGPDGTLATLAGVTAKTLLQPLRPALASGPLPLAAGLPPAVLGQARFPVTSAGRFPQPADDSQGTHCPSGEVSQRTQRHILSHCLHSLLRPLCTAWPGADASRNVPARL